MLFVRITANGYALMLTQSSPDLDVTSTPDADPRPVFRYTVTSAVEASVLARVIELFTLRDLIPTAVSCQQMQRQDPEMRIDVEVSGLDTQHAEHLALRMRNMMPVMNVLLDVRRK